MTTIDPKIAEAIQKAVVPEIVTLYELDATDLGITGLTVLRFTTTAEFVIPVTTLTSVSTTATVTTDFPHVLTALDTFIIRGVDQSEYNGIFTVDNVVDADTLDFIFAGSGTSPATGTIELIRQQESMVFDGNSYSVIEAEIQGFEWNGQGPLPRPTIRISNVTKLLASAINSANDLVGAKLTRIRTLRKHLDDGSDPDTTAVWPTEVYIVDRKAAQNKLFIEFELASAIDQADQKLPGRQYLRKCNHRYRVFDPDTGTFDSTNATCPYVGAQSFTILDTPTGDGSQDNCSRGLSGCRARFPDDDSGQGLPGRFFPGVGGVR